jgi:hypothetical protein
LTFFVDRSLGGRTVPTALRDAGFDVIAHDDTFTPETDDQTWLAHVGRHHWIVLMRDDRIRYRHEEREALVAAVVCAFVLTDGNATGEELAAQLVERAADIIRFHTKYAGPYIVGVYREPPFLRRLYPTRRPGRRQWRRRGRDG